MTYALITGALFRDPETKISKNGKPFVVATIISKDGESTTFANIVAFSDGASDAILALRAGDALCVQGKATIGVYEKNGEHRPSLSIVADRVLALHQPPKERKPKAPERPRQERLAGSWTPGAGPNDSIPFGAP
jgi:single-stranded DNA-binding protein